MVAGKEKGVSKSRQDYKQWDSEGHPCRTAQNVRGLQVIDIETLCR